MNNTLVVTSLPIKNEDTHIPITKYIRPNVNWLSWRLASEANNILGWDIIPTGFEGHIKDYMLGNQYLEDSKLVIGEALRYVQTLHNLPKDGNNVWVFDIDETLLSNVTYFVNKGFGSEPLTSASFPEWVSKSKATVMPESQKLYNKVVSLGIKVVLLSGRKEFLRAPTITNLKEANYHTWDKLILRSGPYEDMSAQEFKSSARTKLEKEGYRIVGNIGDQWSDLVLPSSGDRVFKLPNPMYFIA
ncbi:HAD superfamily subfamily IIIB acid phosphatase [Euphorbia peplus]|nr:HAD superfamily subfamily IIIB acid phosphatase [Euphorbia peplus]